MTGPALLGPDPPFLGLLSASKSPWLAATRHIGSRAPLRCFHTRAVITAGQAGPSELVRRTFLRLRGPPTFPNHHHAPAAFRPPTTSVRLLALQRLRGGRSTIRGFYLPARFRPQGLVTLSTVCSRPNLAGLVSYRQRSWAWPFRGSSSLRWDCIPAEPNRPGGLGVRPLFREITSGRRTRPPLGFAPQACPWSDSSELDRSRTRASPGLFLPGVCSSTGLACPSASLRPPAWPSSG